MVSLLQTHKCYNACIAVAPAKKAAQTVMAANAEKPPPCTDECPEGVSHLFRIYHLRI